ncbi:MAG: serine/threonine protein kinase [Actinobacteria bacterium]|nr:serine/threonine protein kinase [Actinomycetota bacterium]
MPATTVNLPPRYLDPRPIGSGGMGDIYLATDQELRRDVAVKVLAARYSQDVALRERFKREALAAARLSGNPNIVTIFDVDDHDGRPMIVMEFMPGGSLEAKVKGSGASAPADVLPWLDDAASALDAAHDAGIIHRDVKPGNLLLDARDRVQIADFGIASSAGMTSFTQTGTVLGTAGYLAPEQARGERATAASDRYALAIVAWELLAGKRPFESDTPTLEAAAHVNAPVPSLHAANPAIPAALDPVFERALAKDPARRFATAGDFVGELRHALHDEAGDTGWIEPVPRTAATARIVAPPTSSRARWWIPALIALVLAAGVLAAVLATRGGDSPKAAPVTQPKPTTVVRTVTSRGTTVQLTVTATPPPLTTAQTTAAQTTTAAPPTTTAPVTTAASTGSGTSANNAGYAKMSAGDYSGALPLLEQAVAQLSGSGSTTEAYADYNLAYTRYALGQCTDVLTLLDRSQAIQGERRPIDQLRKRAEKSC